MNAQQMLDELSELQSQRDALAARKTELVENAIPPEVKTLLADIEAEFAPLLEGVDGNIASLTSQVKDAVLAEGATVKGQHLQAVWAKGRISWDTKALDGYAAAHPEIAPFKKEGDPSVSIRKI